MNRRARPARPGCKICCRPRWAFLRLVRPSQSLQARRLLRRSQKGMTIRLPDQSVPSLGSLALRLALDRLGAEWQAQYAGYGLLL
jgi:hypothetical protein